MTAKLKLGELAPGELPMQPEPGHDDWFRQQVQTALDAMQRPDAVAISDEDMQIWFDSIEHHLEMKIEEQSGRRPR
ncbi:hypothetical protein [Zavarzinia sp. CC-PAN008]|uniref:hypothetical protein n=1 Tax=Zavarzinia sp. CC-PAN008 TaxID=3243332 RepID=UPI003F743422